jgi:hypothetical protein
MRTYECAEYDSRREDAAGARGAGINDPLALEEVDFKKPQGSQCDRSLSFNCPITIPKRFLQGF